jgi:4-amino-4-deoxy-L-arabinose transferase-like glycosyltransferase
MKSNADYSSRDGWAFPSTSLLFIAILGLTCILRMKFWGQPLEMDEGVYGYMGWGIHQGLIPYKDMYTTKPPGMWLILSSLFLLVEPTALNIQVFASVVTVGTVLAVFAVVRKIADQQAGLMAALLYGIFSSGPNIQGGGVNSEVFMVLPYTLAAYSVVRAVETGERRHYLLFGLFTGLACTFKQVAVVNLFWVALYLSFRIGQARDWDMRTHAATDGLWVAAGAMLPWLPFVIYFFFNDALGKFYFWVVSSNLSYIGDGYQKLPTFTIFLRSFKSVLSENSLLWLLALAGIAWCWEKTELQRNDGASYAPLSWQKTASGLMAIWPLFSMVGIGLGGRFFAHYYIQIIPPLAVLGGLGLRSLTCTIRTQGVDFFRRPTVIVVTGVFAWSLFLFVVTDVPIYFKYDVIQISQRQYDSPVFAVTRFIGKYIRGHTQKDDFVYVWAVNPEINFYALRRSPSPILVHHNLHHFTWDPYEEVTQSLQRTPPKYIVALQPLFLFPALQEYVQRNCKTETTADLDKLKQLVPFEIYRCEVR